MLAIAVTMMKQIKGRKMRDVARIRRRSHTNNNHKMTATRNKLIAKRDEMGADHVITQMMTRRLRSTVRTINSRGRTAERIEAGDSVEMSLTVTLQKGSSEKMRDSSESLQ